MITTSNSSKFSRVDAYALHWMNKLKYQSSVKKFTEFEKSDLSKYDDICKMQLLFLFLSSARCAEASEAEEWYFVNERIP